MTPPRRISILFAVLLYCSNSRRITGFTTITPQFTQSIRTTTKHPSTRSSFGTPPCTSASTSHLAAAFVFGHYLDTALPASSTAATTTTATITVDDAISSIAEGGVSQNKVDIDAIVVGAGPAGLLTAIMLAQKSPNQTIQVFDRLSPPPSPTDEAVWSDIAKFYLIGLGGRGQKALKKYGVWEDVKAVSTAIRGRKDWSPEAGPDEGAERIYVDKPVTTRVLPRDKLVGVLHEYIMTNYAATIELRYGYEVEPEDFAAEGNTAVSVRINRCSDELRRLNPTSVSESGLVGQSDDDDALCDVYKSYTLSTKLLIGADGSSRTVANAMEREDEEKRESMNVIEKVFGETPFKVKRYIDDNVRVYKTIPMKVPSDWRPDVNYSARSKGARVNFDALPADKNGNYCGVFLISKDDEFAAAGCDTDGFRSLLDETLPQFSALLDDETVAAVAKKGPSLLPSFRYAGPRLHQGDHTLILGDCAHTVKPYFGLGANSALEDVVFLEEAIDNTSTTPEAVRYFSADRAEESKILVQVSRELDRPGARGFLSFILPLILDSIFHGILPKIFAPNVIAMLQKDGMSFKALRQRKRMDRAGQVLTLVVGVVGGIFGVRLLLLGLVQVAGGSGATVAAGIGGATLIVAFLRKFGFYFNKNLAPADVMVKTRAKITDNDAFLTPLAMKPKKDNGGR
eukprot:CAMPEP_0198270948 /NCGR_PEP_ID=MMETSP1447-20131203/47229_1 /TAXON_ID=420782 /ORGANISM="Chaetoceros dichaeta, Strain CCMP1751" /LENGTH=683 /DNA_ID=CAMNT_0043963281 /DNA_START=151 /DNA_END=2202 /DNA_ORIENTATION=+